MPSARPFWQSHTSVKRGPVSKSRTRMLNAASNFGSHYESGFFFIYPSFQWPHRSISRQWIVAATDVRFYGKKGYVTNRKTWYAMWRGNILALTVILEARSLEASTTGKWEDLFSQIFTCWADSIKVREIWNPKNKIFIPQGKDHSITTSE